MPNFKKPIKSIKHFVKNNFFNKDEVTLSTSSLSASDGKSEDKAALATSSLLSSNGKSKDKEGSIVVDMKFENLKNYLVKTDELLRKISNLEKEAGNKFEDLDIISLEGDFKNKLGYLYDVTKDFYDVLTCYMRYGNVYDNSRLDPSRLTKATEEYEKYLQKFEQFEKLDTQREALKTRWKILLKNKTIAKERRRIKEIINELTLDAFQYLNDQDHENFKEILEKNECLYNQHINELKFHDLNRKLYQFLDVSANHSPENYDTANYDVANDSKPESDNHDNQFSQQISVTTTTTTLFPNKNTRHDKEKSPDNRRSSFSF